VVQASFLQSYGMSYVGEKLTRRLRVLCFDAVVRQEVGRRSRVHRHHCGLTLLLPHALQMAYFDKPSNSTGRLTSRLAADAALVRATTGDRVGLLLQNNIAIIAGLVIAFVCTCVVFRALDVPQLLRLRGR
jgi:ATP-binding cassette subfamily B (MDR/TAP) protein 1